MPTHLRLRDVRAAFRLIGDVRQRGADPAQWRPLMVRRLRALFRAEVVVSSEVHVRAVNRSNRPAGTVRVIDVGWGCDGGGNVGGDGGSDGGGNGGGDGADGGHVWRIESETDAPPAAYLLSLTPGTTPAADVPVPVRPTVPVRSGSTFILSQSPLAHLGAVDQLGVHRGFDHDPFTAADHRLLRLFHVELGRLWRRDALRRASDPLTDLPPRLAQTLAALRDGCSEKEVSTRRGISPHTVHNYVKTLHQRLGATSRGELLAKTPPAGGFVPQLSVPHGGGR